MRGALNARALVMGAPGLAGAVLVLAALLLSAMGVPPFTDPGLMTLPEAAALESEADVVRLLRAGADPDAPAFVRRTRIRGVYAPMTPLEAAMTSRHISVMDLLVQGGATVDAARLPALWCVAASQRNEDALAWLRARVPAAPPADCAHVPHPRIAP